MGVVEQVRPPGLRARVRRLPGGALVLKSVALVVGLALIGLGVALVVLPGPLTIPPVLAGLYVLSTEFAWAERLLSRARQRAVEAWEAARARPVSSALVTTGGVVAAGVLIGAVAHFDVVGRAREALGL